MLDLTPANVGLMLLASTGAGLVDAIVGGGGLIMVPSLFGLFPQALPATLLGTNKAASVWGTGWAAWQFSKQVRLPSSRLMGAIVAALAWFIPHGHVDWALALPMAVANVAGSSVGTRLALRHGTGFVRGVFLVVVGALILKTAWDAGGNTWL